MIAVRPLNKRVVVRLEQADEKSKGGIYLPEQAKEKPQTGIIVAAADDCETVKVKERVVFAKYTGTEISVDGVEYVLIKDEDILGVIE